jgi:autotransporter-associated beta strand protein
MNSGTGQVNLGAVATGSQGASIIANQNWKNDSASSLSVNRVSVDDASAPGTYTLTINGSGSGGTTFLSPVGDVNSAIDPTRLLALVINTTGGNTTLTSANTFSGGVTLTQGRLVLNDNLAAGSGTLALNGGILASSGTRSYTNAVTIGGNVTFGDITPNNGKQTNSGTVNLGAGTRTLTTVTETTFSGVVSNGGITKQGASTLTFLGSSANTFTGLTTVSAGGLILSKSSVNAIAGDVLVNGTGTLTLGAADQIINTSNVEVAAGTFALVTFNEIVNGVKLTGGTITGTTGVLTSSTAYDFQSSANVTGILAGTAGANKTTAGTVTFTGANANTYTGLTTVSAGSLVLNRDNNVDSLAGDVLVNGTGTLSITKVDQIKNTANVEVAAGTLAISGNAETVNGVKLTGGAITGSGSASVLTSTTAFDFQSGSSTAVLSGTAGVTKTTGGTVSLGRASTYSGGTTLTAGTLQIASASSGSVGSIISSGIGTGTLNLNGGTLSSGSGTARTLLNDVTVGGNVTLGDASNSGTLSFSAGVDLGGSVRTLTTASAINFDGVVSNGGISKAGAGNLTLGGANTYTGTTSINAGTLAVTGSLLNSGTVLVNDGGSLSGSGSVGAVTLASGSFLKPGNSPGTLTAASSIWQGGSTYSWETLSIPSSGKVAGTDWDLFSVTGALDMSALSSSSASTKMNLVLNSLSLAGFDTSTPYTWVIAKAGSFTEYTADNIDLTSLFNIETVNFNGGLPANLPTGGFQVVTGTDSSNLRTLNLMAIPEPSTGTLLGFGLGGLVLTRLLRRKQS